ncbi:DUF7674 family protein [Paraglaciecola hydrolytica]|uniref:DUF7674 family protein n=1 Tax=Paraglaciecola hydrolytica TaxID=1799789 RepID=UPI0009E8B07A|nr:hypothetical protein [Paraglaciecola hydrolytica]
MNRVSEYVEKLKAFIPEFPDYWSSEDAAFNFGKDSTVHGVFSDFSTLVVERLEAGTLSNGEQLFSFIESVLAEGGDPANAACTCFLENILNRIPGPIDPNGFVPYLGPKSKEFCRGWDEFTGVKTSGL